MSTSDGPRKYSRLAGSTRSGPVKRPGDTNWEERDYDNQDESAKEWACEQAIKILASEHLENRLSAYTFCILAHFCCLAGMGGRMRDFAEPPVPDDKLDGRYKKKVRRNLGIAPESEEDYDLFAPGFDRTIGNRCEMNFKVRCPVEQLAEEVDDDPEMFERPFDLGEYSEAYKSHPLVQNAQPGQKILPYAVYLDGVPFSIARNNYDSVLGVSIINLLTGVRHMCASFRKSDMCRCGCKNWCTMAVLFFFFRFQFEALGIGFNPSRRHDDLPWTGNDFYRAMAAGLALGFIGVCLFLKGDWAEFSVTMGLPTWADGLCPCFVCKTPNTLGLMYKFLTWTADDTGFEDATHEDYELACKRCETHVEIPDIGTWRLLRNALKYDKRTEGVRGLVLNKSLPDLKLVVGDRIEPSWDTMDTGKLLEEPALEKLPLKVVVWRREYETRARHRNPIFDSSDRVKIGVRITSFAEDVLHTMHLGIMQVYILAVLWALFEIDVFQTWIGGMEERVLASAQILQGELFKWYVKRSKTFPNEKLTHINTLKASMFGSGPQGPLKTKAAETFGLLLFVLDLLEEHKDKLSKGDILFECGKELLKVLQIMKSSGDVFTEKQYQDLLEHKPRPFKMDPLQGESMFLPRPWLGARGREGAIHGC